MGNQKVEVEDCPYCGKCPVCGLQNNHAYHRHPPWQRFSCHPLHDGVKDLVEEKKECPLS